MKTISHNICNQQNNEVGILKADAENIKKALIDWLDTKYSDKTITTEISINTSCGVKVADVVLSNGHTVAYEIKSQFDTTKRLHSQLKGYSDVFEYVYFVYWGDKYDIQSLMLSDNIGLIEAFFYKNRISFKTVKKAKINSSAGPEVVAKMLWKNELEYFLNQKNIKTKSSYDKSELVGLFIENFNKLESKKIFRFIMKKRFEKGFLAYKKIRNDPFALNAFVQYKKDIGYLSNSLHSPSVVT